MVTQEIIPVPFNDCSAYIKSSNSNATDQFGASLSLSGDGNYLAIGTQREDSNAIGINGNQTNNSSDSSGAVYIFVKSGGIWSQEAYIKASNTDSNDQFSFSVSINADGSRLAVGSNNEDSNTTGINGNQTDNLASNSGAVYIFTRTGTTWAQEAYIKASNTEASDYFGYYVDLDNNANRLVVGAPGEDSNATGSNGDETNNSISASGAVYIFTRTGTTWNQQAYVKASNTNQNDRFGKSISLNANGNRLLVGAEYEASRSRGLNGNQTSNGALRSGAAYLFERTGSMWSQILYIKACNADNQDLFYKLSLDASGTQFAISATDEDSNATGVDGNMINNDLYNSGAVYIYDY